MRTTATNAVASIHRPVAIRGGRTAGVSAIDVTTGT
jgi:hypothetical protein